MRCGQIAERRRSRYLKLRIKLLEATRRQLGTSRGELQQTSHFGLTEIANACPEPCEHATKLGRVAIGNVMRLEVTYRVLPCAAHE